jgi:ABC-type amino acid transport substrate-binding protein
VTLRAMQADGTLDRLAERWLGTSLTDFEDRLTTTEEE